MARKESQNGCGQGPRGCAVAARNVTAQRPMSRASRATATGLQAGQNRGQELLRLAMAEGRDLIEPEAYALLADYGIPVPRFGVAKGADEAARIAREIGCPVVMKVVSPDILHKSDVGGVCVGVGSDAEARQVYGQILSAVHACRPNARVAGVLVAEMAGRTAEGGSPDVMEVIIGVTRDPQFGHAVMFGLGGIFVEVLRDVTFRVVPVKREDALEMLSEIKGHPLLEGARGRRPRDVEALVDVIVRVSRLVEENPEIAEVDLNPVLALPNGACAVDAKISFG